MSANVILVTERQDFDLAWTWTWERLGFSVCRESPVGLASVLGEALCVVIDGGSPIFDEDELLAAAGFCRAAGLVTLIHLPSNNQLASVEELLDEMCEGLIVYNEADIERFAARAARRFDPARGTRFEFVTVASDNQLLAIMDDGRSVLVPRPLDADDDHSDVVSISIDESALVAILELSTGKKITLSAASVQAAGGASDLNNGDAGVDGTRLGARLRKLRLRAGLTQAELARRTGIHRPNIARVEAGRHTPSLETLARVAAAIGVPTTQMLTED